MKDTELYVSEPVFPSELPMVEAGNRSENCYISGDSDRPNTGGQTVGPSDISLKLGDVQAIQTSGKLKL